MSDKAWCPVCGPVRRRPMSPEGTICSNCINCGEGTIRNPLLLSIIAIGEAAIQYGDNWCVNDEGPGCGGESGVKKLVRVHREKWGEK